MSKLNIIKLSASKLKKFQSCTADFYYHYILKVPQKETAPLYMGSATHLILELLFTPKHNKYLKKAKDNVFAIPSFVRLMDKHLSKHKAFTQENLDIIQEYIKIGLKADFLCKGADFTQGEYEFSIPFYEKYMINGFIFPVKSVTY